MEIRTGEWQGGRRALLACKLKCCHLNANKTPSRARARERGNESRVDRVRARRRRAYGGERRDHAARETEREEGGRGDEGRSWQIARQRRLRGREEISKRILLPPSNVVTPLWKYGAFGSTSCLLSRFKHSPVFQHFSTRPTTALLTLNFNRVRESFSLPFQRFAVARQQRYELWNTRRRCFQARFSRVREKRVRLDSPLRLFA